MAFSWLINGGDPNYLLSGMILQAPIGEVPKNNYLLDCLSPESPLSWVVGPLTQMAELHGFLEDHPMTWFSG